MTIRELYHGTDGDTILAIIRERRMKPGVDGTIFFSQNRYESVLMHGADTKRKATFAIKVRVQLPPNARTESRSTMGVSDTLVVHTLVPISAEILELYIRQPRGATVQVIRGAANIQRYLQH